MYELELKQLLPTWDYHNNNTDVNIWSRVHPRYLEHDGCVVDLGCLNWDWSGPLIPDKRVIGVDPQETERPDCEFFKGAISNKKGRGTIVGADIGASVQIGKQGDFEVIKWKDLLERFNIDKISILKVNIEGGEWNLIKSLRIKDFKNIDQISISFHNWLIPNKETETEECINKILKNGYEMFDLGIYGWKLFLKKVKK